MCSRFGIKIFSGAAWLWRGWRASLSERAVGQQQNSARVLSCYDHLPQLPGVSSEEETRSGPLRNKNQHRDSREPGQPLHVTQPPHHKLNSVLSQKSAKDAVSNSLSHLIPLHPPDSSSPFTQHRHPPVLLPRSEFGLRIRTPRHHPTPPTTDEEEAQPLRRQDGVRLQLYRQLAEVPVGRAVEHQGYHSPGNQIRLQSSHPAAILGAYGRFNAQAGRCSQLALQSCPASSFSRKTDRWHAVPGLPQGRR